MIVLALIVAALILRRLPGIVLGLTALLLLLDRVVGFSPWGVAEADRRFAQLARERRRAAVARRLSSHRAESGRLDYLDEIWLGADRPETVAGHQHDPH
jgi:hypothetical protein